MPQQEMDGLTPQAMTIPKEGYFQLEQGRYGPVFPRTPACHGFTVIAKLKPGREPAMRAFGAAIEKALRDDPSLLASLKLHYIKWVIFDIGNDKYFMYQAIFDTDFDKYTDDAVAIFTKSGVSTSFENLEGFPEDWKTNIPAFIKFVREHHRPSFMEYGEYPYVSADEIKKALKLKKSFSENARPNAVTSPATRRKLGGRVERHVRFHRHLRGSNTRSRRRTGGVFWLQFGSIEKKKTGGTVMTTGGIATKTLREAALHVTDLRIAMCMPRSRVAADGPKSEKEKEQ